MTARDLFPKSGIHGFADYRFHVAAALCLFSTTLFYESVDAAGAGTAVLPLLTAFILASASAWRRRTLGTAESAAGLALHALLALALAAGLRAGFCAGLEEAAAPALSAAAYADYPAWSVRPALWMAEVAGEAVGRFFPPGIFARFATAAAVLLAVAAFVARRRTAAAAAGAAIFLPAAAYLGRAGMPEMLYFAAGGVALAAAWALAREDAARRDFWFLSLRRMEGAGRAPRAHYALKLEVLGGLFGGKRLDRDGARLMAARRLRCDPDDARLDGAVAAILRELADREGLVEIVRTDDGESLRLARRAYDGGLIPAKWKAALQAAAFVALGLGYLLSPVDFMLDMVPASGLLDDAVVLLAVGAGLWRTVRGGFSAWYSE